MSGYEHASEEQTKVAKLIAKAAADTAVMMSIAGGGEPATVIMDVAVFLINRLMDDNDKKSCAVIVNKILPCTEAPHGGLSQHIHFNYQEAEDGHFCLEDM